VIRLTSEISKQAFPVQLDVDNPTFWTRLARVYANTQRMEKAREKGGIGGRLTTFACLVSNVATLAQLYFMPAKHHALPADVRMQPVW
jgi:magnesium-protoporphyrin IX monomethyl ester (oxidative) cyclase